MNTNRGRRYALVQVGSLLLASCASAPTPIATEESAREFAATFLRVFEDLDMAKFIECFAEDATVFFPAPETPMRYNGRGAIRDQFQLVFNAIKGDSKAGLTCPPISVPAEG